MAALVSPPIRHTPTLHADRLDRGPADEAPSLTVAALAPTAVLVLDGSAVFSASAMTSASEGHS
jgi:hypothetical protein